MKGRCPRCWVVSSHCVCAAVPRVETRTRVLVIRHWKERWKSTNTARLAALALPSLEIVEYGGPGPAFDARLVPAEHTWVLFPDSTRPRPPGQPGTLVVLDGTWAQVRQMSHRVPRLSTLPRLSLPPPAAPALRLRAPPHPDGMATLEAIAHALGALEGEAARDALLALFDRYVASVLEARGARPAGAGGGAS